MKVGIIAALSVLLACQVFTQSLAYQAGYTPALGTPVWTRPGFRTTHGVYLPWQGLGWAWRWGHQASQAVRTAALWAVLPVALGIALAVTPGAGPRQGRAGGPPPMTGHGTGRWARRHDARKARLL